MKAASFFLMICMALISVLPGKGQSVQAQVKMDCCKKMTRNMPCNHQQKQDCKHGMCLTRLCCNVSGFTPISPLGLTSVFPPPGQTVTIPYTGGVLSDYSAKSFRPPRV